MAFYSTQHYHSQSKIFSPLMLSTFSLASGESTMIGSKRLVAIARRWRKLASIGRRRISMSKADVNGCNKEAPIKGHFIIYTTDKRRFAIPLACHNSPIFQELLKMSEDEYGLPSDGPITIPCDAAFMEYIISLLQRAMPKEVERALITMSMATGRCSFLTNLLLPQSNPPIHVHGY